MATPTCGLNLAPVSGQSDLNEVLMNRFPKLLLVLQGIALAALGFTFVIINGCAHRNRADIVDTSLEKQTNISDSQGESVGVRDKEFVLQKKKALGEELRKLEENVRELDDRVYGTREYASYGVWGKVRDCRLAIKDKSADFDPGPLERASDSEYLLNWKANTDAKAGIEKNSDKLVAMSEEDLDKHITKLNKVKSRLQEREDELNEKLIHCAAEKNSEAAKN
jgi:hypothetical protein